MTSGADPQVSVVLCVYNAEATLARQLAALAAQQTQRSWELVVVDNRCTDGSMAIVAAARAAFPVPLVVVEGKDQQGLAYARNVGFARTRGAYVLMCDADDEAAPGWVDGMARALDTVDLVGGSLDVDTINPPETRRRRSSPTTHGLPPAFGITDYPMGASCGGRRAVIDTLGGWDPRYTICGDDVDLGIRAFRAGFTIGFAPDAVMHYRLRPDLRSSMRQRYRYALVSAYLRRRHRDLALEPASPPLWRLVPWLLVRGIRYPWLADAQRDDLLLTGAKAAGRVVGGVQVAFGRAS